VSYAGKGPVCLDGIRCTYWITRDRDPVTGELVDFHVGRALATRVKVELGVIPETDLECIRVDGVADIKVTPV
jgi:hypothetical protein